MFLSSKVLVDILVGFAPHPKPNTLNIPLSCYLNFKGNTNTKQMVCSKQFYDAPNQSGGVRRVSFSTQNNDWHIYGLL